MDESAELITRLVFQLAVILIAAKLAGEYTFKNVFDAWVEHRRKEAALHAARPVDE